MIDIYDHEIAAMGEVLGALRTLSARRVNLDRYDQEIKDRFAAIGFRVDVKWYSTDVPDVYAPDIEIIGRFNDEPFDHDRQVHEVTSDLLGLNEGGVIKTDGLSFSADHHKH